MTEELISAADMRALERAAIDAGLVSGLELMERAGQAVVSELRARWPGVPRAIVLCGPGNNGGDGFVIARGLLLAGLEVSLFLYGDADKLSPDARRNYDRWADLKPDRTFAFSKPVVTQQEAAAFSECMLDDGRALFVIDALFGIGLTRPLGGLAPVFSVLDASRGPDRHHISIDVPSGLSEDGPLLADGGRVFPADMTVTFHCPKIALQKGRAFCGEVVVADIGL